MKIKCENCGRVVSDIDFAGTCSSCIKGLCSYCSNFCYRCEKSFCEKHIETKNTWVLGKKYDFKLKECIEVWKKVDL